MNIKNIDLLFNLILIAFWIRLWARANRDSFFNPYVYMAMSPSDKALEFLDPVIGRLPDIAKSVIVILFLFVLKCLLLSSLPSNSTLLPLTFGISRVADISDLTNCAIASAISLGITLFYLWALSMIYTLNRSFSNRASNALQAVSQPVSSLPLSIQPIFLILFGCLLTALIDLTGLPADIHGAVLNVTLGWEAEPLAMLFTKLALVSLAGFIGIINLITTSLIVLIIASWIGMMTARGELSAISREFIDMLMGPMRRYPIMIGMMDITPIIFLMVLGYLYDFLMRILSTSIQAL